MAGIEEREIDQRSEFESAMTSLSEQNGSSNFGLESNDGESFYPSDEDHIRTTKAQDSKRPKAAMYTRPRRPCYLHGFQDSFRQCPSSGKRAAAFRSLKEIWGNDVTRWPTYPLHPTPRAYVKDKRAQFPKNEPLEPLDWATLYLQELVKLARLGKPRLAERLRRVVKRRVDQGGLYAKQRFITRLDIYDVHYDIDQAIVRLKAPRQRLADLRRSGKIVARRAIACSDGECQSRAPSTVTSEEMSTESSLRRSKCTAKASHIESNAVERPFYPADSPMEWNITGVPTSDPGWQVPARAGGSASATNTHVDEPSHETQKSFSDSDNQSDKFENVLSITTSNELDQDEIDPDENNQDENNQDENNQDENNQDENNQDENNQDENNQDENSQDESKQDEINQDQTDHDGIHQDGIDQDESNQEGTDHNETDHDETAQDETAQDGSDHDEIDQSVLDNIELVHNEFNQTEVDRDDQASYPDQNDESSEDEIPPAGTSEESAWMAESWQRVQSHQDKAAEHEQLALKHQIKAREYREDAEKQDRAAARLQRKVDRLQLKLEELIEQKSKAEHRAGVWHQNAAEESRSADVQQSQCEEEKLKAEKRRIRNIRALSQARVGLGRGSNQG